MVMCCGTPRILQFPVLAIFELTAPVSLANCRVRVCVVSITEVISAVVSLLCGYLCNATVEIKYELISCHLHAHILNCPIMA
jgi:hypothetical protein